MTSRSALEASGKKFRTQNISDTVQKIVISPIKEMSILAERVQETSAIPLISFGQGIPHFDTPDHIKEAIRAALADSDTAKYTLEPGIIELRMLLAHHLMRDKNIANVDGRSEVMITVGCQEAVCCALRSIIDEGDEVLIPSPGFASHSEQIIQFGGVPVFVPLNQEDGWSWGMDAVQKSITSKTRVILFSNPSNPTGAVHTTEELKQLAAIAIKHDLIIIADETYDFLTYDGAKHTSLGSFVDVRDRVIVCGSFSKKYAMTGYRVGYAYACEGIIDHMLKVHDALAICAPAISQKGAMQALTGPQDNVQDFIEGFSENRSLLMKELDALSSFFTYAPPRGAYYIFAKYSLPTIDSFELSLRLLNEAKIVVIPGGAFGPTGEGHLRFSFAGKPDSIHEGFERLRTWIQNY